MMAILMMPLFIRVYRTDFLDSVKVSRMFWQVHDNFSIGFRFFNRICRKCKGFGEGCIRRWKVFDWT